MGDDGYLVLVQFYRLPVQCTLYFSLRTDDYGVHRYIGVTDFGKLLDVYHHDFRFALRVAERLRTLDVGEEFLAGIDSLDNKAARREFVGRLFETVESVHDEIELRDDAARREEIGKSLVILVGERGLPAALRVPNDARFDAF